MKSEVDQMRMLALFEELGSYRAVGEIVGCDPKTVKATIARHQSSGPELVRVRRGRVTDQVTELIRDKVAETKAKITAKRLLPVARADGYQGSARSLRRAVREAKARYRATNYRIYRPWRSAPGEFLICDWASVGQVATPAGMRALSVFCAVLGFSRLRMVWFTISQGFTTLAESLHRCLEQIGGVPAKVLFDNPKTVTVDFVVGAAVLSPDLVRLAAHYRFEIVTCERADPESKGKVEALVRYVEGAIPDEGFRSLDDANAWGATWCDEANAEVHPETCAVPATRFLAERDLLRQLPALRPALACGERRKVDKMSTIRLGSARYSVPTRFRGQWVRCALESDDLVITADGVVVATHPLVPPGESSIKDEHYPSPAPTGVRRLRPRSQAERDFLELGPEAEAWLRAAAAAGTPRLAKQIDEAMALVAAHGKESVQAALGRAAAFRRFSWGDLASIIASAGQGPPEVAPVFEVLAIPGLPEVPVRNLADYRVGAKAQVAPRHTGAARIVSEAPSPSTGLLFRLDDQDAPADEHGGRA